MSNATLRRACAAAILAAISAAAPAAAQDLTDLLPNLLGADVRLAPPTGPFPSHEAHFLDDARALAATARTLDQSLVEQLSSVPLASSASGFTYVLDPALGTFTRSTESFGPVFTERTATIGRRKWSLGFNYLRATYDKLDDLALDEGDIQFQLGHQDIPGELFFEGDVIGVRTSLDVESQTAAWYVNYGVTDRFDVAVVVPWVRVEVDARAELQINRLSTTGPGQGGIHLFTNGTDRDVRTASGSASGVGDVVVRGKVRFGRGFATALDVRLPTGDEEELLGTGFTQTKLSLLASGGGARAGLHGNLGYSVASGSSSVLADLPDELSYGLGLDVALRPRVTLAVEAFGRTLFDATQAVSSRVAHQFRVASNDAPVLQTELPQVSFVRHDQQLLFGSLGLKINPTGNLLLTADAILSLSDDGLQPKGVVAVVGAEYSF